MNRSTWQVDTRGADSLTWSVLVRILSVPWWLSYGQAYKPSACGYTDGLHGVVLPRMSLHRTRGSPMPSDLSDSHPNAERVQLELLGSASVARRLALARSLSATAIQLSRRAIARANPDLSAQDLDLLFVEYHYGAALAECLRSRRATE